MGGAGTPGLAAGLAVRPALGTVSSDCAAAQLRAGPRGSHVIRTKSQTLVRGHRAPQGLALPRLRLRHAVLPFHLSRSALPAAWLRSARSRHARPPQHRLRVPDSSPVRFHVAHSLALSGLHSYVTDRAEPVVSPFLKLYPPRALSITLFFMWGLHILTSILLFLKVCYCLYLLSSRRYIS